MLARSIAEPFRHPGGTHDVGEEQRGEHSLPGLRRLGPADDALEIDLDGGLISDDPCVMPRRDVDDFACRDLADLAITALDTNAALEQERHVVELAALCAGDGLDVDRPAEPRFKNLVTDRQRADLHEIDVTVVELDGLVRLLKALYLDARHVQKCVCDGRRASMCRAACQSLDACSVSS